MTKDEALKLALEALTNAYWPTESDLMPAHNFKECAEAITAIKEALAQPEQKPVACVQDLDEVKRKHLVYEKGMDWKDPLYTTPPQRNQVLEEAAKLCEDHPTWTGRMCAQTIRGLKK